MEPNYVIIVIREKDVECFGSFVDFETAFKALNEQPSRFGAEDDCIEAFIAPLQALYYNQDKVDDDTLKLAEKLWEK